MNYARAHVIIIIWQSIIKKIEVRFDFRAVPSRAVVKIESFSILHKQTMNADISVTIRKTKYNINIYKLTCSMPRLNDIE